MNWIRVFCLEMTPRLTTLGSETREDPLSTLLMHSSQNFLTRHPGGYFFAELPVVQPHSA